MKRFVALVLMLLIPAAVLSEPNNFSAWAKKTNRKVKKLNVTVYGSKTVQSVSDEDAEDDSGLEARVEELEAQLSAINDGLSAITEQVNSAKTLTGVEEVVSTSTLTDSWGEVSTQAVCPTGKVAIGGGCEPCPNLNLQFRGITRGDVSGKEAWYCRYRALKSWNPDVEGPPTCTITAKVYCADAIENGE